MNDCVFELDDVAFAYRNQPALNGISLKIRRGERVVLLGANGSGKSTLLRLLDALEFPSGGQLQAFGEVLSEDRFADDDFNYAFRRRVGLVFQNPDVQLFNPSVFDEVAFGPLQLRWPRDRILSAVDETLARFAILHLKDRASHRLSGGEKKRVALASVLILEPEVLLLDEPTAALDPESQGEMIRFLSESQGKTRTIVTATHDLHLVEEIADYVFVLAGGRVAGEGKPADILAAVELLRGAHLLHTHLHTHADGEKHRHPHSHRHAQTQDVGGEIKYRPLRGGSQPS